MTEREIAEMLRAVPCQSCGRNYNDHARGLSGTCANYRSDIDARLARLVEAATRYLQANTGQQTTGAGHLLEQRAAAKALRAALAEAGAGKERGDG